LRRRSRRADASAIEAFGEAGYALDVSAAQIIEAIKKLPPEERIEVVQFAREYETVAKLSPEQLGRLGERLANATDPTEIAELEKRLMNGFYGIKIDA